MGRLDVRIVEARNLPNTETFGKPDPYVKVEIEQTLHKTSVADGTLNPKWDEVFKFVVADPNSAQLVLKLWDSNMASDTYMGEYKMSIAGLTKGVVKDQWCLLQQCKTQGEIHVRLMAHDFGMDAPAGAAPAAMAPAPAPMAQPEMQHQQPMMQQQQPMMQQQPQMGMQQPMAQPGYPQQQQQPNMGGMMGNMMGQMGAMMGGMQQQMGGMQGPPSMQWADGQPVQLTGNVVRATYGPAGSNQDYTMQVQQMCARGQRQVFGGIHTVIGDPNPGVPKTFQVWYG